MAAYPGWWAKSPEVLIRPLPIRVHPRVSAFIRVRLFGRYPFANTGPTWQHYLKKSVKPTALAFHYRLRVAPPLSS